MTTTPASTSRLTMLAATLAAPLAWLATSAIGILILLFGVLKLVPREGAADAASTQLLNLATGGVIASPWGMYLIAALQIALGLGLLIRPARPLAGLGCLFTAVLVVVGMAMHWSDLTDSKGLNATGLTLVLFIIVLLAGAAFGTRAAARRVGAAA